MNEGSTAGVAPKSGWVLPFICGTARERFLLSIGLCKQCLDQASLDYGVLRPLQQTCALRVADSRERQPHALAQPLSTTTLMSSSWCPTLGTARELFSRAYYPLACMLQPFVGKPAGDAKKLEDVSSLEPAVDAAARAAFAEAASLVQQSSGLSNAAKLGLYALYKQALVGDAPADPPSAAGWDVAAKLKWRAWVELRGMPRVEATYAYTRTAHEQINGGAQGGDAEGDESIWDDAPDDIRMGGAVQSRMAFDPDDGGGADSEAPPLHAAAKRGDARGCRALLEAAAGATAVDEADADGQTALHWAADGGHANVAAVLLEFGASPDAQDADGSTPLHMACVCEQLDVARLLVERGADVGLRDGDGQSAADLAPSAMAEALGLRR